MKYILCLSMVSLGLTALQATPLVDPDAWETQTTPVQQLVQDNLLVLPAGTQLYRNLSEENITLSIRSNPVFSTDPEQVAILEFGTNAIAFTKEKDVGRITLVADDLEAQTLTPSITLDQNDRPTETLALELTRRDGLLFLTVQKQNHQVATQAGPTQIVLSAGASQDWTIENLQVTFEPLLVADASDATRGRRETSDGFNSGTGRFARSGASIAGLTSGADDEADSDDLEEKTDKPEAKATQRPVRLDVFTPPAIRLGRSAEVRASLNRTNLK